MYTIELTEQERHALMDAADRRFEDRCDAGEDPDEVPLLNLAVALDKLEGAEES